MGYRGTQEVKFNPKETKFTVKIIGQQVVGQWTRVIAQAVGSDDQPVIDERNIYVSTKYNSLLFRNAFNESVDSENVFFKTKTLRYKNIIKIDSGLVDEIKMLLAGKNSVSTDEITYDEVKRFCIQNNIISSYDEQTASDFDKVSTTWNPRKVVAVYVKDNVGGTNYMYDGNDVYGRVEGNTITLKQDLPYNDEIVWIDYFVGGVIMFDFKPTMLTDNPESLYLIAGSNSGYRNTQKLSIQSPYSVGNKSISVNPTSIINGETADISISFSNSNDELFDNMKCRFYLLDSSVGTITPNNKSYDSGDIGSQEIETNFHSEKYKILQDSGDNIYFFNANYNVDEVERLRYASYSANIWDDTISNVSGNKVVLCKRDDKTITIPIFGDLYNARTLSAGSTVRIDYYNVSEKKEIKYNQRNGYLQIETDRPINEIIDLTYEDDDNIHMWGDPNSFYIGKTIYLCLFNFRRIKGRTVNVGERLKIKYSTKVVKAEFKASTAKETTAVILAVPILPDNTEDIKNIQRAEVDINRGVIHGVEIGLSKTLYSVADDIDVTTKLIYEGEVTERYVRVSATPTANVTMESNIVTVESGTTATFRAQDSSTGYITFSATVHIGNRTINSNSVTVMVYDPDGLLLRVLDRGSREPIVGAVVDIDGIGAPSSQITNSEGYVAWPPGITPGTYTLRASATGYTPSWQDNYDDNDEVVVT